jgi:hypothetical protein
MKKSTLRNFHVPLSEDLYSRLREEAGRSKQPATALARHAGTSMDLDEELESASLEQLCAQEENAR